MQNIEKDQGAFDETVLEILGLEALYCRDSYVFVFLTINILLHR